MLLSFFGSALKRSCRKTQNLLCSAVHLSLASRLVSSHDLATTFLIPFSSKVFHGERAIKRPAEVQRVQKREKGAEGLDSSSQSRYPALFIRRRNMASSNAGGQASKFEQASVQDLSSSSRTVCTCWLFIYPHQRWLNQKSQKSKAD